MSRLLRFASRTIVLFLVGAVSANCLGVMALMPEREGTGLRPWWLLLLGGGSARQLSSPPTVVMGSGVSYPATILEVTPSAIVAPARIEGPYNPIGQVYEIAPAYNRESVQLGGQLVFPEGEAELRYTYDTEGLASAGLVPEFSALYWDEFAQDWKPAARMRTDPAAGQVSAFTNHLTPFVLTAVSGARTELSPPPACITADFPSGIGGTGGGVLTTIGDGRRFYQDRSYRIRADAVFRDLGFEGALAIATCNGGGECGTFGEHKHSATGGYLSFTAHADLDVYLMYDASATTSPSDGSQDAPWIASSGFVNTGRVIETSGPSSRFRVYRRSVARGVTVSMDGNRLGVTSDRIDTNYWVVLKRRGEVGQPAPNSICESQSTPTDQLPPGNLRALPGATTVRLTWDIPASPKFTGVIVRRSTIAPPATPTGGQGLSALGSNINSFTDSSAEASTTYFYTVFATFDGSDFMPAASTRARTGPDQDGDGLSDVFERDTLLPEALGRPTVQAATNPGAADTDGDGVPDGEELARGSDPTNPDASPPTITAFTRTSPSPATYPVANFTITASDDTGVTGYLITTANAPPLGTDSRWSATAPTAHELKSSGAHSLYAWVRDGAGNVSAAAPAITVQLDGIKVARNLYAQAVGALYSFSIDSVSGELSQIGVVPSATDFLGVVMDPLGRRVYVASGSDKSLLAFPISATGNLSSAEVYATNPASTRAEAVAVHPAGTHVYVASDMGGSQTEIQTFAVDNTSLLLSPASTLTVQAPIIYVLQTHPDGVRLIYGGRGSGILALTAGIPTSVMYQDTNFADERYFMELHPSGGYVYTTSGFLLHSLDLGPTSFANLSSRYGDAGIWCSISPADAYMFCDAGPDGYADRLDALHLNEDGSVNLVASVPTENVPRYGAVDPSGTLLFVPVGGNIRTFRFNPQGSSISAVANFSGSFHRVVLRTEHSANDPPVANPGPDRWTRVGQPTSLIGANSYDPDRYICSANAANYVTAWSVISVPGGSGVQVGSGSITTPTQLNASFTPDVAGDYVLELSFTDDPGTCVGSPRTSARRLTIRAGYEHTTASQSFTVTASSGSPPVPGAAPAPGAQFRVTSTNNYYEGFDLSAMLVWEFDLLGFLSCQDTNNELLNAGAQMCSAIAGAVTGVPSAAFGGTCGGAVNRLAGSAVSCANFYGFRLLFPYCVSKYLPEDAAVAACATLDDANIIFKNQRWWVPQIQIIGAHHFWPVALRQRMTGYWHWWAYTP